MNKKIAIIGAGGHGKVVGEIALLNEYNIIDFFDDQMNEIKNFPFKIIGSIEFLKKNLKLYDNFLLQLETTKKDIIIFHGLKKKKQILLILFIQNQPLVNLAL